ncbi:GGDEF domain-containing protein [Polynucleobacter sp. UK-Gri1-W3]|uniref:GGDEF domain-containing protein n=1 Tax=Polynucleobacter sp. UK-Gri1-W3 TaxID=1819737 RepID=UPI001C0D70F5|nr:GGDEF domain-containing protein [Polynucleobacter sp. UK-Gri1-W3]
MSFALPSVAQKPYLSYFLISTNSKKINDNQGHQRGDEILRTVGAAIKLVSRVDNYAFRYGGDEFCVILPNYRENLAREIYVSRLNAEIHKHEPDLSVSAGVLQLVQVFCKQVQTNILSLMP